MTTAAKVKELRDLTGAGMMECKRALEASQGDREKAIAHLRKSGQAKAEKRSGKVAAEGLVLLHSDPEGHRALIIEVNTETDFVARDANLAAFSKVLTETAWAAKVSDLNELLKLKLNDGSGHTVEEARQALVSKVGENIVIRRLAVSNPQAKGVGAYRHGTRIAVIVELDVDNKELGKDLAMHIAASRPAVISQSDVSPELIAKEKEIYAAQSASSGKPAEIIEKMAAGKLKKFLDEVSLLGQRFVKQDDITVSELLKQKGAKVISFTRFEVGEGIEKIKEDFAQAVMSQIQGS